MGKSEARSEAALPAPTSFTNAPRPNSEPNTARSTAVSTARSTTPSGDNCVSTISSSFRLDKQKNGVKFLGAVAVFALTSSSQAISELMLRNRCASDRPDRNPDVLQLHE